MPIELEATESLPPIHVASSGALGGQRLSEPARALGAEMLDRLVAKGELAFQELTPQLEAVRRDMRPAAAEEAIELAVGLRIAKFVDDCLPFVEMIGREKALALDGLALNQPLRAEDFGPVVDGDPGARIGELCAPTVVAELLRMQPADAARELRAAFGADDDARPDPIGAVLLDSLPRILRRRIEAHTAVSIDALRRDLRRRTRPSSAGRFDGAAEVAARLKFDARSVLVHIESLKRGHAPADAVLARPIARKLLARLDELAT